MKYISFFYIFTNFLTEKLEDKVPKTEWDSPERPPLTLFGNLPFNVATPFIIRLLRNMSDKNDLFIFGRVPSILTFQHEVNQLFVYKMFSWLFTFCLQVALRMCAPPKSSERCRLSVICQNWADIHYKFMLAGGAFVPPPEVLKTFSVFNTRWH